MTQWILSILSFIHKKYKKTLQFVRELVAFVWIQYTGAYLRPWWRHEMETFSALLAFCAGNSPVPGEFPSQRPVMRSFVFSLICACINGGVKIVRLVIEMRSRPLWRHCNGYSQRLPISHNHGIRFILSIGFLIVDNRRFYLFYSFSA